MEIKTFMEGTGIGVQWAQPRGGTLSSPVGASVQVLTALFPNQLPANAPRRQLMTAPASLRGDPDGIPES